jgi:7,8-dihydropterin-6-yl-methyl-4-(beta-D-ribofuranosyl)aminobenzene 5'-phosphate synthase
MAIRFTTLTENTANYGFMAEWGFSILIEADGRRILMDTGMSCSAVYNAQLLGVDLNTIDTIVLSHGHLDHTGGLGDTLRRKQAAVRIIAHPDIWADKYIRRESGEQCIGLPFNRPSLESMGARFELSREPVRITDHVTTSGEIPMTSDYETIDDNLLVRRGSQFVPDPLADDLALIINTGSGLVVVLGCAHHGLINTLRHARKITGQDSIYAVIGGTHLLRASPERLTQTVAELREMGVQMIGVSHCTGFYASSRLAEEFPEGFFLNNAGTQFTLP